MLMIPIGTPAPLFPTRTRILLSAAVMTLAAGCGGSSGSAASGAAASAAPPAASSEAPASAAAAAASGPALKIAGFDYSPKPLTVTPGQVITVNNDDAAAHTVSSDIKGLFLADDVEKGKTVTFMAPTKAGIYTFFCAYHPKMHGSLVVAG